MTKCIYKASHCPLSYSVQDPLLTLFCFLWHFRISLSKPIALPPLLLLLLSELELMLMLQLYRQSFVTCSYQLKFNDIVGRRSWVWQSPVAGCQLPIAVVRMFLINFKWRFTFRETCSALCLAASPYRPPPPALCGWSLKGRLAVGSFHLWLLY